MNNKIETFYTGGGITIAETDIDKKLYAVVSSEAPEFFSIYKYDGSEKTYLPDDMLESSCGDAVPSNFKPLHAEMREKLKAI